ncbi:2-polyprenyl-6-methoxyphenol hydroxylase-like FAD-dependent oxidoreductase [Rhodococcus sp. LBL1]|nr:2-polyprenyl-6-methoxyphenol hydroxylase-like FAD-dependent oxidoreductase [Rhodococcus sp. LBL1]MDH6684831.1 2-polyprenyl-6-methoxyphenol hydroxylase-like FAD-dependent oxidoreductase [Rhodococcus sp. LBL2]
MERTSCCIVGGGPAGMVLGLLLARCGVPVTVLEKHGDFLRDFRGDTVHPSTLALLDDLGLGEQFARLPQRHVHSVQLPMGRGGAPLTVGHIDALPVKHNYIAMVPQWDLLNLLADEARTEPTFTLRMNTEALSFLDDGRRICGVRYRTADGEIGTLHATLTVACDGRGSLARDLPELGLRAFRCPMDAWWFRLPRDPGDPKGLLGNIGDRFISVMIDRGEYWQCGAMIPKGADAERRAAGLDRFANQFLATAPWLGDRVHALQSWDQVKLLDVRLDRLRRWYLPGLLCIGDAAHAMSPIFGIGINLAVEDAVAAARHLADRLPADTVPERVTRRIQVRRWPTAAATQALQRLAQNRVISPALAGAPRADVSPLVRRATSIPGITRLPAYFFAFGAVRERPPAAARR